MFLAPTQDYPGQHVAQFLLQLCIRVGLEELHRSLAAVRQSIQRHQQKAHVIQRFNGIPEIVPLQGDVDDGGIPYTLS